MSKICMGLLTVLMSTLPLLAQTAREKALAKEALKEVGEIYVGQWDANTDAKIMGRDQTWKETWGWSWKFGKEGEAWLTFDVKNAKFFTQGKLSYDLKSKKYLLETSMVDKSSRTFTGTFLRGKLSFVSVDSNKDKHTLTVDTAARGIRLVVKYEVQRGGIGLPDDVFKTAGTKAGESFAGGGKKGKECVVTGGLGTIQVSYMGKTYYVCCSGCKEEFDANPKKYVDEFNKKNK